MRIEEVINQITVENLKRNEKVKKTFRPVFRFVFVLRFIRCLPLFNKLHSN